MTKETPITPAMLGIMRTLAENLDAAHANAQAAAARFASAVEQLEAYIRQCAILLDLPDSTPFDKPKAVFIVEDKPCP